MSVSIAQKIKELVLFAADNAQEAITNLPLDWRQGVFLFKGSGIAFNLLATHSPLAPGTLYDRNPDGTYKPSGGRVPSPEEQRELDVTNDKIREMDRAKRDAVDDFIRRTLPYTASPIPPVKYEIPQSCKRDFESGLNWTWPRDPLVLDLDNDGIELTSSNSTVLFDHNADGVKTGTQWVRPDDAMLVRDLNGNGVIDSGRELFGDQTQLPNGQLAVNGFAALAALDNNHDAVIDASDAAFADLRVWRDLNQDGISQTDELQSLSDVGITSINIPINLSQTNSSFVKTSADGVTSATQAVRSVNFAANGFYSEFLNNPIVTDAAAALPQMQGSGLVRDMREAMSLGTAQSNTLEQTLQTFKTATTTEARQALLSSVATAWANTSSMGDAVTRNPIPAHGAYGVGTSYEQWNVNTGTSAVTATARDVDKSQIFLGQGGAETFTGGDLGHVIMAGDWSDTLSGGAGDNIISASSGNPTNDSDWRVAA